MLQEAKAKLSPLETHAHTKLLRSGGCLGPALQHAAGAPFNAAAATED